MLQIRRAFERHTKSSLGRLLETWREAMVADNFIQARNWAGRAEKTMEEQRRLIQQLQRQLAAAESTAAITIQDVPHKSLSPGLRVEEAEEHATALDAEEEQHMKLQGDCRGLCEKLAARIKHEQRGQLNAAFDFFDADDTGTITEENFREIGRVMHGAAWTAKHNRAAFGQLDRDADGLVSREEFLIFYEQALVGSSEEVFDEAIRKFLGAARMNFRKRRRTMVVRCQNLAMRRMRQWHLRFAPERSLIQNWISNANRSTALHDLHTREVLRLKAAHRDEIRAKDGDISVLMDDVLELEACLAATRAEIGVRVVL